MTWTVVVEWFGMGVLVCALGMLLALALDGIEQIIRRWWAWRAVRRAMRRTPLRHQRGRR